MFRIKKKLQTLKYIESHNSIFSSWAHFAPNLECQVSLSCEEFL